MFIDALIAAFVIGVPAIFLIGALGGPHIGNETRDRIPYGWWLLVQPAATLVWLACLALFDASTSGATPGKRVIGLRVIDVSTGGRVSLGRALLRRLVYLVEGIPLYLGWIWPLFDRQRRAWHDIAARTLVVEAAPGPESHG